MEMTWLDRCGDDGRTATEIQWWWWSENNNNMVVVEGKQQKCNGGGGGGRKTIDIWAGLFERPLQKRAH